MKKILFIIPIIALNSYSTLINANSCPPEYNYVKYNTQELEKYRENVKSGKVDGLYNDIRFNFRIDQVLNPCPSFSCIYFDSDKYQYAEFFFFDSLRKGVYTSKYSKNKNDIRCKEFMQDFSFDGCYYLTKNENNEIKSQYGYYYRLGRIAEIQHLYNLKDGVIIYESSSFDYCLVESTDKNYVFKRPFLPANPVEILN